MLETYRLYSIGVFVKFLVWRAVFRKKSGVYRFSQMEGKDDKICICYRRSGLFLRKGNYSSVPGKVVEGEGVEGIDPKI